MTRSLAMTLAAAILAAIALPAERAGAAAVAAGLAPALAGARPIIEAAVLCAGNGCNVVQTKQVKHRKFVPLQYTKPIPKAS